MNRRIAEVLVGLTVALGLIGIAALLLLFGEFAGARRSTYPITLELNDASSLSGSSAVTLNGVSIGAIEAITSAEDPRRGVLVRLKVEQGIRIPRDVTVALDRGLVGEASLSLRTAPLPAGGTDPGYLAPGDTLAATAQGMFDQIGAMMDSRLGAFTGAAESIRKLSDSLSQASEQLNETLRPRTPEEVDSNGAPPNLSSTVARVDRAFREAQTWLGDDALRTDVRDSVAQLRKVLTDARNAVDSWSSAAQTLTDRAEDIGRTGTEALQELAAAARALGGTADDVQALIGRLNQGEGTAGQLLTNPDLYRNLNDAVIRLEKALTEAQLLVEKYRKEGIPLRF